MWSSPRRHTFGRCLLSVKTSTLSRNPPKDLTLHRIRWIHNRKWARKQKNMMDTEPHMTSLWQNFVYIFLLIILVFVVILLLIIWIYCIPSILNFPFFSSPPFSFSNFLRTASIHYNIDGVLLIFNYFSLLFIYLKKSLSVI